MALNFPVTKHALVQILVTGMFSAFNIIYNLIIPREAVRYLASAAQQKNSAVLQYVILVNVRTLITMIMIIEFLSSAV